MTTSVSPTTKRFMARIERVYERYFFRIFVILLLLLCLNEAGLYFYAGYTTPDWLYISTVIVFVIGIRLAIGIPQYMDRALIRLANRGALRISPEQLDDLKRAASRQAARWAQIGGVVGFAALDFGVFVLAGYYGPIGVYLHSVVTSGEILVLVLNILFFLVESVIGYFVGYYLGYAAANGRMGPLLKRHNVKFSVQPNHPDGAAGLQAVGTLLFSQALLLAIPALFLGIWWVLIQHGHIFNLMYSGYLTTYLSLFVTVILVEVLFFIAPMFSFHEEMWRQKQALASEADQLSYRIVTTEVKLVEAHAGEDVSSLNEQLTAMRNYYRALQRMPTWPVDTSTFLEFLLGNLGLFLSLALSQLPQLLNGSH